MARRRPYTRESLENALRHHGVTFHSAARLDSKWLVESPKLGTLELTPAQVYAYCLGLADAQRAAEAESKTALASWPSGLSPWSARWTPRDRITAAEADLNG